MLSPRAEVAVECGENGARSAAVPRILQYLEVQPVKDPESPRHNTTDDHKLFQEERERLVTEMRQADDSDLVYFYEALTQILPRITDGVWDDVISTALAEGRRCPTKSKFSFQAFVVNLILQNMQYLAPVISRLVQNFAETCEDATRTIHESLRCLVSVVPRSEELLLFYIEKHFPHSSRSDQELAMYVRMALNALSYAKASTADVISLLIRRLVALELEYLAAEEQLLAQSTGMGNNLSCLISEESCEDLSVFDVDVTEGKAREAELRNRTEVPFEFSEQSPESLRRKLDLCLDHVFRFCQSSSSPPSDVVLDAFYAAFEKHALPVAKIRRVPFVLFVYLSRAGPPAADTVLRRLLTVLVDSTRPGAVRALAVLYAGALAASNTAVTLNLALQWMKAVCAWMHSQLERGYQLEPTLMENHEVFTEEPLQAAAMAVLYVIGDRATHFFCSEFYREQIRSMRLARIMLSMPDLLERIPAELKRTAMVFPEFSFLTEWARNLAENSQSPAICGFIPFREYDLPDSQRHVQAAFLQSETRAISSTELNFDSRHDTSKLSLLAPLCVTCMNGSNSSLGISPSTSN
jgi:hypothetical protein